MKITVEIPAEKYRQIAKLHSALGIETAQALSADIELLIDDIVKSPDLAAEFVIYPSASEAAAAEKRLEAAGYGRHSLVFGESGG